MDGSGNAYLAGRNTLRRLPHGQRRPSHLRRRPLGCLRHEAQRRRGRPSSFRLTSAANIFDAAQAIALDSSNNIYITGRTSSPNYPTLNPIQASLAGGGIDAFITKINAAGTALVYSTYLGGGSGMDIAFDNGSGIDVDSAGNAYVTGQTRATDFPTVNPIQATFGGGFPDGDGFVTKINAAGSAFVFSTYLGGSDNDVGADIDVDSAGLAHVGGFTSSSNFPTANAFDGTFAAARWMASSRSSTRPGTAFAYSTYLGGSGSDAATTSQLTPRATHTSRAARPRPTSPSPTPFKPRWRAQPATPS